MAEHLSNAPGRQINLTTLGEDFLSRIEAILVQVDDLEDLVRSSEAALSGRFRLGVIPTVAPYLLPSVIKGLAAQFPELEIQPREAVTQSLVRDILASRLDAALVALPIAETALQAFALLDEEFFLVRPSSEAGKPVPSPAHLHAMRLLLLEEGHCFRDQALSVCNMTERKPQYIMEGSSLTTLVQMVGSGIGVTLIPQMALSFETRFADVCVAPFTEGIPSRSIGMIWRKANPLNPQFMEIGEAIKSICAANDPAGSTARGPAHAINRH